jgi:hypothetical protein
MTRIYGAEDSQFEPASVDIHDAVCAEFVDLGMKANPFDGKELHQGQLVFQVAEEVEEGDFAGQRKEVRLFFNMKLGTPTYPSKIRKIIEKWRGKPLTDEEVAEGFSLEALEGVPCRLDISHKTNKDGSRTYAVVDSISKAGRKKLKVKDYTPVAERSNGSDETVQESSDDDEDLPF